VALELPPHAPAAHGFTTIEVEISAGIIQSAEPILGAMHRGAEKLFESRDYRQIMALANRHEWLASFTGELGVALLLERELGIEPPDLAAWLRTLLVEYHRITSHLAFLGGFPWADADAATAARNCREDLVEHLQSWVGTRMHTMSTVVGGLLTAAPDSWLARSNELANYAGKVARDLRYRAETLPAELGIVDRNAVANFALSGPVARAAGVADNVRLEASSLRYSQLDNEASVTHAAGDVAARMAQLAAEIQQSADLVAQCARRCVGRTAEPVNVLLPKVLRIPVGEYSSRNDTPLGTAYWYLVSTGDKTPQRLGVRPASLHTVLSLTVALPGATLAEAAMIVASMPFIAGDAER
jgi:NADH-quinone oxidoreductase subunit D